MPKKYKGTRSSLGPGPSDREGVETAARAMEGMKSRYLNTTKADTSSMGSDGSKEVKEWLSSKE